MKQEVFIARHRTEWEWLRQWLDLRADRRDSTSLRSRELDDLEFPRRYRRLCQHLAIARNRLYSPQLIAELAELTERGHQAMYKAPQPRWNRAARFLIAEFPHLVRRQGRYMFVSALLFFVPLLLTFWLMQERPELIYSVLDPMQVAQMEAMYDPEAEHHKLGRSDGSDVMMFGFYVLNNVGIGFRTFASGALGCVGAVVVLFLNGLNIGSVAGHLHQIGYGDPFWRFVVGHSAPELLAIVIAGGAGLRLGMAILAPGRRTRRESLIDAARIGAKLCLGILVMLVFAAFVEAFWSSIVWIPRGVKFSVGGALWALTLLWLWRGGRGLDRKAVLDAA